jgi:hypothetical protein
MVQSGTAEAGEGSVRGSGKEPDRHAAKKADDLALRAIAVSNRQHALRTKLHIRFGPGIMKAPPRTGKRTW